MPELSRFFGIIIRMLFSDDDKHHKPHVHVYYGEYSAAVGLDGELLEGKLPENSIGLCQVGLHYTKRNYIFSGTMQSGINL